MDVRTIEEILDTYQKTGRYTRVDGTLITHQEYSDVLLHQASVTHIFNTNTGSQYRFIKQCVGTAYAIMASNEGTSHISISCGSLVISLSHQDLDIQLSDLLPYGTYYVTVGEQKVRDIRDWARMNETNFNTTDDLVYKNKISEYTHKTSNSSSSSNIQPCKKEKYSSTSSSSEDAHGSDLVSILLNASTPDIRFTLHKHIGAIPSEVFEHPLREKVYLLLRDRGEISDECNKIHYLSLCIHSRNNIVVKRLLNEGMIPTDNHMRLANNTGDRECIDLVRSKYTDDISKLHASKKLMEPNPSAWLSNAIRCNMPDDVRRLLDLGVTPARDHVRLALLTNNSGALRLLMKSAPPTLVIGPDLIRLTRGNPGLYNILTKK